MWTVNSNTQLYLYKQLKIKNETHTKKTAATKINSVLKKKKTKINIVGIG